MLWTIARFELGSRMRLVSTYVYFLAFFALSLLWMAAAGGAFASANVVFDSEKVFINSPYALAQSLSVLAMLGIIVIGAVMGRAVQQDFEHHTFHFFFTAPLRRIDYLGGRFLGALLTLLFVFSSIGLGAFIGSHLPWVQKASVGPDRLAAYLVPYLYVFLPNALLIGSLCFGLAAITRRMLPVYVLSVVFLIGYLGALSLLGDVERKPLAALLDPFGIIAMGRITEYWSVAEKNSRMVPLVGLFLWNRLLWLGVSAILCALWAAGFRFEIGAPGAVKKAASSETPVGEDAIAGASGAGRPVVPTCALRGTAALRLLPSLTALYLRETIRNMYFAVIVLAGVLFMILTSTNLGTAFGTHTYPTTYLVLEQTSSSFTLFMLIIVTFYAGELLFRERDSRMDQIHDSLPVPSWLVGGGKLLALLLLPVLLQLLVLFCGLVIQLAKGYFRFELALYLRWLFLIQLPRYWLVCLLAFSLQILINNKYMGHFAMVLYYVAGIALGPLGLEHHLYRPLSIPEFVYSEMNGFGSFLPRVRSYQIYWAAWMILLLAIASRFWVRGTAGSFRERARVARLRKPPRSMLTVAALSALVVLLSGAFIYYNTNVLNEYRTTSQRSRQSADYEKKYKPLDAQAQPRVVGVRVEVDLRPESRSARARGEYVLLNRTAEPIPVLHLALTRRKDLLWHKVETEPPSQVESDDPELGPRLLKLSEPLAPGARMKLRFESEWVTRGFPNHGMNTALAENGTFLHSDVMFPSIGYQEGQELQRDRERKKYGLAPRERMRDRDDPKGLQRNYITPDSDFITYEATVSTSPDQIAISPGYLQREWTENGRRYFHYKMDAPILNFYSFLSARYQVKKDRHGDVNIEVYYHPGHEYNLDRMIEATKAGLDYFNEQFGPYQHRQFRILEFPRYESFAQAFPNTIPYSERIGFIARVDPKDEKDIDYPYYITAHELAHQWWAHQVVPGDVQGATLLSETLAQYSALMLMKKKYGADKMKRFLRYELDRYLIGRATEVKKEVPLARVENQPYIHYQKGSLVMYALQDYLGEDVLNKALHAFRDEVAYKGPPYPNATRLLFYLRQAAPPGLHPVIEDLFESITLFENRAEKATVQKLDGAPDREGGYEVTLKLRSGKLKADAMGQANNVPIDDLIDIGVFGQGDKGAGPKPLYLQKHRITTPELELRIRVKEEPLRAGIDPYNKLIDRIPEDNVIDVSK